MYRSTQLDIMISQAYRVQLNLKKSFFYDVYAVTLYLYLLHVVIVLLISEEEREDEEEAEQLSSQPTAKIGAKKQKKLEEKQARKAQREVRGCKQFRTIVEQQGVLHEN